MANEMKAFEMKIVWLLGVLAVVAIVLVGVQNTAQASPDASQEAVEAASDAQRVRRIREVIEFDLARLEQARADQPQRQALFDRLAEVIEAWKADQQEKRLRLEQTGDPEKRVSLEREIAKLDDELELLRAQSELAFSALTTVRQPGLRGRYSYVFANEQKSKRVASPFIPSCGLSEWL